MLSPTLHPPLPPTSSQSPLRSSSGTGSTGCLTNRNSGAKSANSVGDSISNGDDGASSFVNRMRDVVMTHYRKSPSAPDRPIDLTHVKDSSTTFVPINNKNLASASNERGSERPNSSMSRGVERMVDDDDEDYVPPGLADFVATVDRNLEEQQKEFELLSGHLNTASMSTLGLTDKYGFQEELFYSRGPSDEKDDEESTKEALRENILPRYDIGDHKAYVHNEEYLWSPDAMTLASPHFNPVSMMSESQIKKQALMTPCYVHNHSKLESKASSSSISPPLQHVSDKTRPKSPSILQCLPPLQFSDAKKIDVSVIQKDATSLHRSTSSISSLPVFPHKDVDTVHVLPNNSHATTTVLSDQLTAVGQEVVILGNIFTSEKQNQQEQVQFDADSDILPNEKDLMNFISNITKSTDRNTPGLLNVKTIDEPEYDDEWNIRQRPSGTLSPSPLSMSSPSKGMIASMKQSQQHCAARASSPIYGFAPVPENKVEHNTHANTIPSNPLPSLPVPNLNIHTGTSEKSENIPDQRKPSPIGALLSRSNYKKSSPSSTTQTLGLVADVEVERKIRREKLTTQQSPSYETNLIPSPPKQLFTKRPPSKSTLKTPSPRHSMCSVQANTATASQAPKSLTSPPSVRMETIGLGEHLPLTPNVLNQDGLCANVIVEKTQESIKYSPTVALSTPSPLSMSSPRYENFETIGAFSLPSSFPHSAPENISLNQKRSNKSSQAVPRFRTPPSTPRIKTAKRFTAEAAERLSRPSKSPPPLSMAKSVPHYASPLKSSSIRNHRATKTTTSSKKSNSTKSDSKVQTERLRSSAITKQTVNTTRKSSNEDLGSTDKSRKKKNNISSPSLKSLEKSRKSNPTQHTVSSSLNADVNCTAYTSTHRRSMERLVRHSKSLKGERLTPNVLEKASENIETYPIKQTNSSTTTDGSTYKLAPGFEKSVNNSLFHKPTQDIHLANETHSTQHTATLTTSESIIDRLNRPTIARMTTIQCTLHPPPPEDDREEPDTLLNKRSPSIYVFTDETAERLLKPTVARRAAIIATERASKHGRITPKSLNGASDSCDSNSHRLSLPPTLDATSHLLQNTTVSNARKTTPKKILVRPTPPTKYVSGVSDRLMSRTASSQASLVSKTSTHTKPTRLSNEKSKFISDSCTTSAKVSNHQRQPQQDVNRQGLPPIHRPKQRDTRPLTVPCGPRCANVNDVHKQRKRSHAEAPTLAQRLDKFNHGLRDDFSVGSSGTTFSQRCLTIPNGPKLSTDIRGGEKYKPPKSRSDVSLAQSSNALQNTLRSPYYPEKKGTTRRNLTIPVSPKFATIHQRSRPKSTAEIEADEVEYIHKNQFKAHLSPEQRKRMMPLVQRTKNDIPGFMKPTQVSRSHQRHSDHLESIPLTKPNNRQVSRSNEQTSRNYMKPIGLPVPQSIVTNTMIEQLDRTSRAVKAMAIREEARQRKMMYDEEERQELMTFKAKPVPRTTYEYTPIIPIVTGPLVEPFSPALQTKQRVLERKEFDMYAERERQMKMNQRKEIEEQRQADDDEELYERRRLPVSEGGMIPIAAPINAALTF